MQLRDLALMSREEKSNDNQTKGISHFKVAYLIEQIKLLASGKLRLPVPRYFYQTLQSTSIKLSIAPQPRVLGEPVSVPQGSQLALKVEGVLRHGKWAALYRSVAAIVITISTAPPSKNNQSDNVKKVS